MKVTNEISNQVSIAWSVTDVDATGREWTYMDIYVYPKAEYDALDVNALLQRQTEQYNAWRLYCETPEVA